MATRAARYAQSFFGDEGSGLIGLPGASILIREAGTVIAAPLWANRTKTTALVNPLPTGVPYGTAGLDVDGNAVFYADPGDEDGSTVYEAMVTVGNTTVGPIPIGTIPPDMADVGAPIPPGTFAGVPAEGTLAARPLATAVAEGDLYLAVDGVSGTAQSLLARSDGAEWVPILVGDPAPLGLYERTIPTPALPAGSSMRPVAVDPNHLGVNGTGRIWAVSNGFAQVVFSDDDGATSTVGGSQPGAASAPVHSLVQMYFSPSFLWAVCTPQSPNNGGQVFRSPLPDAAGAGIVWTKVWDGVGMAFGPAGAAENAGDLTTMRNACLVVDPASGAAYLLEYSSGQITGGPSLYFAANGSTATPANIVWTRVQRWSRARHGHAIQIINGKLFVSIGDLGYATQNDPDSENIDIGLWVCSSLVTPTTWAQINNYGESNNGRYTQIINFRATTHEGSEVLVAESDQRHAEGPILFPKTDGGSSTFIPLCHLPPPYVGTMRQMTMDPTTRNLFWCSTGESGGIGPVDSLWASPPPYNKAYLLESVALGTFATMGDPVFNNGYFWIGNSRCVAEKFAGQA